MVKPSKILITGIKHIYVSSFYKPHKHDEYSLKELWSSVEKIPQNSHVWILGDFNLPDMNWSTGHHQTHALSKNCMTLSLKT